MDDTSCDDTSPRCPNITALTWRQEAREAQVCPEAMRGADGDVYSICTILTLLLWVAGLGMDGKVRRRVIVLFSVWREIFTLRNEKLHLAET